ncbi:JmjC domain-containing protein [Streptomyces toxytricini]|uniref:JmjC domain-containing protein n=1 Tax=Streptomyces toxytricini TaxID=67369 RepID=A0ABW8EE56_STRT5
MRYRADPPSLELSADFVERHWEREPLLVRGADAEGFRAVFTREDCEDLLHHGALRSGFVTVVAGGNPVPHELLHRVEQEVGGLVHDDLVDPEAVVAYRERGATVILAGLQLLNRTIAALAAGLTADTGRRTEAHAFHTPPGTSGLARHFDGEDNFLFQIEGTKHWDLAPPLSDLLPVAGGRPPADHPVDESRARRLVLRPGDLLYIPRGWLHASSTGDEDSLHVTVQVLPDTVRGAVADQVAGILAAEIPEHAVVPDAFGRGAVDFAAHIRATARALDAWADEVAATVQTRT